MKTSKSIKKLHHKEGKGISLKAFANSLVGENRELAQTWLAHKNGVLEREAKALRLKNKGPRIAMEKMATKAAKRKSKAKATTSSTDTVSRPMIKK